MGGGCPTMWAEAEGALLAAALELTPLCWMRRTARINCSRFSSRLLFDIFALLKDVVT